MIIKHGGEVEIEAHSYFAKLITPAVSFWAKDATNETLIFLTIEEAEAMSSDLSAAIAEAIEFKAQTVHANSQPSFERGCISPEPVVPTESVPPG